MNPGLVVMGGDMYERSLVQILLFEVIWTIFTVICCQIALLFEATKNKQKKSTEWSICILSYN